MKSPSHSSHLFYLPKFLAVPLLPQGAQPIPAPVLVSEEQHQQPQRFLLQRQGARQHAPGRVPEASRGPRLGREGNQGNPWKMLGKMGIEWDLMGV